VVLAGGVNIHPDLFDLLGNADRRLDAFAFGRGASGGRILGDIRNAENADFHAVPLSLLQSLESVYMLLHLLTQQAA
jgi:hypothetical protein